MRKVVVFPFFLLTLHPDSYMRMKKKLYLIICLVAVILCSCSKEDNDDRTPILVDEISYNILTTESAQQFFRQEKLHEQISSLFVDMCMHKAGYPYNDWLKQAESSMKNPDPSTIALVDSIAHLQQNTLRALGIKLPIAKQTNVIDLTMEAFGNALAFTSGTRIYADLTRLHEYERERPGMAEMVMWHEMWHVISRNNPDLRRKMYSLIGFNVLPTEIEIPAEVKKHILCNPDVERHDSYATFNINGKSIDCMLLLYAEEDEYKPGMELKNYLSTTRGYWLLALDSQTHKPYRDEAGKWVVYNCTEASDFDKVMSGGNTSYCDDPEECMADNFSYAMMNNTSLPNQKLLQDIRALLK